MRLPTTLAWLTMLGSGLAVAQSDTDRDRVAVRVGGGVETYSGELNDVTNAGPAWGVTAEARPLSFLGVELGYSGAANEADEALVAGDEGFTSGPDLIRNGAHLALTLGPDFPIQPYVLGGFGVDRYTARGEGGGFADDTSAAIPLGVGVRGNIRGFTADLRAAYSVLLSEDFAPTATDDDGGRFAGTLQLGGSF